MASTQEVHFEGYATLAKAMKDALARAVANGQATKIRFMDANGTQHDYRDTYELLRAIELLEAKGNAESAPPAQRRRGFSVINPS